MKKILEYLLSCHDWVDTAKYLSGSEYRNAKNLEWQAMKEEACQEQARQAPID